MKNKNYYLWISRKVETVINEILRLENVGVDIHTPRILIYYNIFQKHCPRKSFNDYLLTTHVELPFGLDINDENHMMLLSIYAIIHKYNKTPEYFLKFYSEQQYIDLTRKIKEIQPALFNLIYFHDVLILIADGDSPTLSAIGDVSNFIKKFMVYTNDVAKNLTKYVKKT